MQHIKGAECDADLFAVGVQLFNVIEYHSLPSCHFMLVYKFLGHLPMSITAFVSVRTEVKEYSIF